MEEQKLNLPIVTVIIPNYNNQHLIFDAMDSVVAQRDYPIECIRLCIVDDCSTGNDYEKILSQITNAKKVNEKQYVGLYKGMPCALLQTEKNSGPSTARNLGIKTSWNGTLIFGFLDSDDIYHPQKIAASVGPILQYPDKIGAVYTDYTTLNIKTGVKIREYKPSFCREHLQRDCIINCDSLVSRLALQTCGLFDETMRVAEDYALWASISSKFLIYHIPEDLLTVRITGEGATYKVDKSIWKECWKKVQENFAIHNNSQTSKTK